MNPKNPSLPMNDDAWASAFIDGEADLEVQGPAEWHESVGEQLYVYTLTRHVLQGVSPGAAGTLGYARHQTTWTRFWAHIDANPTRSATNQPDLS